MAVSWDIFIFGPAEGDDDDAGSNTLPGRWSVDVDADLHVHVYGMV